MITANNRLVKPNISKTSRGKYRCRVTRNGKLYTTYTSNLQSAQIWVKAVKNGLNPKTVA